MNVYKRLHVIHGKASRRDPVRIYRDTRHMDKDGRVITRRAQAKRWRQVTSPAPCESTIHLALSTTLGNK